jgi:carbohydrate kinase (thermoresistant glucokinase family)
VARDWHPAFGHLLPLAGEKDYANRIMQHIIVMGVAGCGKSTLAAALAGARGAALIDADDVHDAAARAKMARGEPLDDTDRMPWLQRLNAMLRAAERPAVLACSALRQRYRDILSDGLAPAPAWVWLDGDRALIAARLAARRGHFFPVTLLDDQFATLEPEPRALRLDAALAPADALAAAQAWLATR